MTFRGYRVSILLKLFANLVPCVQFSKQKNCPGINVVFACSGFSRTKKSKLLVQ